MKPWLATVCLMFAFTTLAFAQQPNSTSTTPQVSVPSMIRFSGQVKGASGTVGITFTLHKTQDDNAALWTESQNVRADESGHYTVLLGAAKAIPIDLFTSGEAQWLAIHITGQPEQRVLLVSVPYAVKALEAQTLAGHAATDFVTSDKLTTAVKQELQQQAPTRKTTKKDATTNAPNPATNFADTNTTQVVQVVQSGIGSGLVAIAAAGAGVQGATSGASGYGVFGSNTSATGTAVGVRGSTTSGNGIAVYGTANGTSGSSTGVKGISSAPSGYGVFGQNTATTGTAIGFRGSSASTSGVAIYGTATSTTGTTKGMLASVASTNGIAAVFQNTAASGKLLSGQSGASNTEVFSVDNAGNTTAAATVSGLLMNTSSTVARKPYMINGLGILGVGQTVNDYNLFIGWGAGDAEVHDGNQQNNVFIGPGTGMNNTTGYSNTFIGSGVSSNSSTTHSNTLIGSAVATNGAGNQNTILGSLAGFQLGAGDANVFLGFEAGFYNTSGNSDIYIGSAGCGTSSCSEDSTIRIGSAQTATYIAGIYSESPGPSSASVVIGSNGKLGIPTSSRRFKEQIADIGDSRKLFQLRPVTFFYKPEYDGGAHEKQFGLIAEEVAKIYPDMVINDKEGRPFTVKYQFLAPLMLNAVQKDHAVIAAQERVIATQQKQLKSQQQHMDELSARLARLEAAVDRLTTTH
ncbi:hypothetical protein Acid345_0354 [Candidatus Koribacter versatilis Ellin345]|uniref:Peptidase S74 domain-containing protein n=1 Tax=Koribacter versatilis (strain Ellin345) TaxID=204669 RepID=Q1IUU1_KORVE|nr:tail fiber domain-containing protein [Candidatus Koribacter versatilis]ABF39359.1 hypothetical protein Acid345_0354 [Candidatus Koribacter versatilis Ellin345]